MREMVMGEMGHLYVGLRVAFPLKTCPPPPRQIFIFFIRFTKQFCTHNLRENVFFYLNEPYRA